jgi:predicted nuclease of predicted toxin-antitoxin system
MKILVDENIPSKTVAFLQQNGYDVADVRGSEEQAIPDKELWNKAHGKKDS